MARRRYYGGRRRRGRKSFKIPVLTIGILAGQAAAAWATDARPLYALGHFSRFYTGFDPFSGSFQPQSLLIGWAPWLVKGLVSKIARPMGAAPRMPFGLPISIS